MAKKIPFILHIEEDLIHELRMIQQRSALSWPSFLRAILQIGLEQFDGLSQAAWADQQNEAQEEQFLTEWMIEQEGKEGE
jgi:hypothetical protein